MTSLVLSGGGVKGAWQAGVLDVLLDPQHSANATHACGISAGGLNAVLAALYATGRHMPPGRYWTSNVRHPSDLFERRGLLTASRMWTESLLGFDGLRRRLDGINWRHVAQSPLKIEVGACNVSSGAMVYAAPTWDNFPRYVLASAAIPMVFPLVSIGGSLYTDGGNREVVPLRQSILSGADRIICVVPFPVTMTAKHFNPHCAVERAERHMDIVTDAMIVNDLRQAKDVNAAVKRGAAKEGQRYVDVHVIRPPAELAVSVTDFDAGRIAELVDQGRAAGLEWVRYETKKEQG